MQLLEMEQRRKEIRTEIKESRDEALKSVEDEDLDTATELADKIEKLQEELNELSEKIDKLDGGDESMDRRQVLDMGSDTREFMDYLETREIDGSALKTDSGFVVVPKEIGTNIKKLKDAQFNLEKYVNVRKVENGSGTLPIVRQHAAPMVTVKELEENPYLTVTGYSTVDYEVKTYRTMTSLSNELIDDSPLDVLAEVQEYFAKVLTATTNSEIINVIANGDGVRTFNKKEANSLDDIKSILNLEISPDYMNPLFIMNQSAYDEVSKLKDNNGRYMLQPDLQQDQGERLLGTPIVVVPNRLLASDGDNHKLLVGDVKEAITLFDRSEYSVAYDQFMNYGKGLVLATRFDTAIVDEDAMVVIDFNATAEVV